MDPQQRVFLELAQQALENAGYDPERYKGRIGVFAGVGDNHYYTTNLLTQPDLLAMAGKLAVEYGNQKDYIALRTAYLLDRKSTRLNSRYLVISYSVFCLKKKALHVGGEGWQGAPGDAGVSGGARGAR